MIMLSSVSNVLKYGTIEYTLREKENYLSFTSDEQATVWGYSHYNDWAEKYKSQTRQAEQTLTGEYSMVEYYCGYLHKSMNGYLRGARCFPFEEQTSYMVRLLNLYLCQAPRIPNDIIVYRVVPDDFVNKLFQNNKDCVPTYERGFMSTSLLETIAENEEYASNKHLLKIYVPKNTIGLYVNPVTARKEQEILIAPNRQLAMIGYPQKGSHGKYVTECMLINY